MNKSPFNWVTVLSLSSALCAVIVVITNATTQSQFSGVFALLSLLFALMAAPMAFTKATQCATVKTTDNKR